MNERIRELAEQADEYCRDYVPNWNMNDYNKKFAELIVRECARIIESQDVDPAFKHRMSWAVKDRIGVEL